MEEIRGRSLKVEEQESITSKLSNLPSTSPHCSQRKRKRSESLLLPPTTSFATDLAHIAYWAENHEWSWDLVPDAASMASKPTGYPTATYTTNLRHAYLSALEVHGVYWAERGDVNEETRLYCARLLSGEQNEHMYSYVSNLMPKILDSVNTKSEDIIRRDLSEWIAPSPRKLLIYGAREQELSQLWEEINAGWTRCETMGGRRPKPDYVVGYRLNAFSEDEKLKLERRASPQRPFQFKDGLCFPFLVVEAKTGEQGLNQALRQNIHSSAMAVRAIVRLYKDAFGAQSEILDKEIYGKVLCFSIAYDCDQAVINAHYALFTSGKESYHRFFVAHYHLRTPADRLGPYNFVYNVYHKFSPKLLEIIRKGVAQLNAFPVATSLVSQQDPSTQSPGSNVNVDTAQAMTELRTKMDRERMEAQAQIQAQAAKMARLEEVVKSLQQQQKRSV